MRTPVASLHGRKPASKLLRGLPVIAAIAVLAPVLAIAQNAATPAAPAAPAAEAPAAAAAAAPAAPAAAAPAAVATVAAGTVMSYTEEQAVRGKKLYTENCSDCHGTTLGGSGETPALAGKGFRERWFIGSPEPVVSYIESNMPQGAPGSLDAVTYADITAYLMSRNRVPAGDAELPGDPATLTNIVLPPLAN